MTMTQQMPVTAGYGIIARYRSILRIADTIPLSLVQLAARVSIAHVFGSRRSPELASWPVDAATLRDGVPHPVLDPTLRRAAATATEIAAHAWSLGLFASALGPARRGRGDPELRLSATLEQHLSWTSLLLLILARGAGVVSLDHLATAVRSRA